MPSLFRLIFVLGVLAGAVFGGLFVLATRFEPESQVISKPVTNVKIKRDAPGQSSGPGAGQSPTTPPPAPADEDITPP